MENEEYEKLLKPDILGNIFEYAGRVEIIKDSKGKIEDVKILIGDEEYLIFHDPEVENMFEGKKTAHFIGRKFPGNDRLIYPRVPGRNYIIPPF